MAKEKYSDCVECADGCHHCGLEREYYHYSCDACSQESDKLWWVGGTMMCKGCIEEQGLDVDDYIEVDMDMEGAA